MMVHLHETTRQLDFIRRCLLQDKIPIGFFLSAGCPLSIKVNVDGQEIPIIPDIAGLTKLIHDGMMKSDSKDIYEKLFKQFDADGIKKPNIEDILSHIRSLQKVAGKETVRGLSGSDLDILDKKICEEIVKAVSQELPEINTSYHKMSKWIKAIPRKCSVEIFTTNYDLLIEQSLEYHTVPYFDGFVGSNASFFDSFAIEEDIFPTRWARLWKLHGSINWFKNSKNTISRGFTPHPTAMCRVIHPSHLKYDESRQMPYLAMIDRLRKFIKKPNAVLIICGYSFHDDHINANLLDSLRSNPAAIVFALVYGDLNNYPEAIKISEYTSNFNIYAKNEAIIGTRRGIWVEKSDRDLDSSGIIQFTEDATIYSEKYKAVAFHIGDFDFFTNQLQEMIGPRTSLKQEKNDD
jgi:hypothetical protein